MSGIEGVGVGMGRGCDDVQRVCSSSEQEESFFLVARRVCVLSLVI